MGKLQCAESSKRRLISESIGRNSDLKWSGQKQQFIHVLQTWSYKHHTELAQKNRHHLVHHASFRVTSIELQHQNKSVTELHSSSNMDTSPSGWSDWLTKQTVNLHVQYNAGFVTIQDIHIDIVIDYKTVQFSEMRLRISLPVLIPVLVFPSLLKISFKQFYFTFHTQNTWNIKPKNYLQITHCNFKSMYCWFCCSTL